MQWVISNHSTAPAIFGSIWVASVICNLKLWKLFSFIWIIDTNWQSQTKICFVNLIEPTGSRWLLPNYIHNYLYFIFVFMALMLDFKHLKLLFLVVHIFFPKLLQHLVANEWPVNIWQSAKGFMISLLQNYTTKRIHIYMLAAYSKNSPSLPVLVLWKTTHWNLFVIWRTSSLAVCNMNDLIWTLIWKPEVVHGFPF